MEWVGLVIKSIATIADFINGTFLNDYDEVDHWNEGSYGTVILAVRKGTQTHAKLVA